MTPRLLHRGPLAAGPIALDSDQQHYLKTVLRLKAGAPVEVFDGQGERWSGHAHAAGRTLTIELDLCLARTEPPRPRRWLGFAPVKAVDTVLRKATELGATDLLPVLSERVQGTRQRDAAKQQRHWTSIIESAAAQCEQDHLPRLHDPSPFTTIIDAPPATQTLLLDPTGQLWPARLTRQDTLLLIGPEGGWTEREKDYAISAGVPLVGMGPLVLRAETAPLAALTRLAMSWEQPTAGE